MPQRKANAMKEKATAAAVFLLIVLGIGYVGHSDYEVKVLEREAGISTFSR